MGTIKIGNQTYVGKSVIVRNGKVIIDGKEVTPDDKTINIEISGDVEKIEVDHCGKIIVNGKVNSLRTSSGDVECGEVMGNVQTSSGDVEIDGNVGGDVNAVSGDIKCGNIAGSVNTVSGDIKNKK
ncbi:MAG: hypothetical protein WC333_00355 [Dehalococcoidia bacterium]|jgi:hypothetical protein